MKQKKEMEEDYSKDLGRPLKPQEREAIWTINGLDHTGKISVCRPQTLKKTNYSRTRVCLPNIDRLHEINQLNISSEQAGRMTEAEFVVTQLTLVRAIYGRFVNVDKVFFAPYEKWPEPRLVT